MIATQCWLQRLSQGASIYCGLCALLVLCYLGVSAVPALAVAPPSIGSQSVETVTSSSATLLAEINPEEAPTSYYFEYHAGEGAVVRTSTESAGSGLSEVIVELPLQNLTPDTAYHFRVVAENPEGRQEETEQTFMTQTAEREFLLPDHREYEMVSPPIKEGTIEGMTEEGALVEAAESGNAITYVATAPVGENGVEGNRTPERVQVVSRREPAGWRSENLTSPYATPGNFKLEGGYEYRAFSEKLTLGLFEPREETPRAEGAESGTAYLRNTGAASSTVTPLVTLSNVFPEDTKFGEGHRLGLIFEGGTPDLSHVLFDSRRSLTPDSAETEAPGSLYEWSAGKLSLVSNNTPQDIATLGFGNQITRNAVSTDGSRIFWSSTNDEHLYMRDMGRSLGATLRVDIPEDNAEGGTGQPVFQTANSEGTRVFFTDGQRLTVGSTSDQKLANEGTGDLYVSEILETGGELESKLTDLTAIGSPSDGPNGSAPMLGMALGAAENGSNIYFVSEGVLPGTSDNAEGEAPEVGSGKGEGEANLYEARNEGGSWKATFIARLSNEDRPDWGEGSADDLGRLTARVSPNGRFLAFMSSRRLTGYDNRDDADNSNYDEEVFLYDNVSRRVVCISCNPTNSRPMGMFDVGRAGEVQLIDGPRAWHGHWLAANIPSWTPLTTGVAVHQSRYLSDEGRIFFNSSDSLVPFDTNGTEDVYEYEPIGVGSCGGASTSGSEVVDPAADGCVSLISPGTSSEESAFLDASSTGGDVFFLTRSRLSSQDIDNALDVYDAHDCDESPCLAAPAVAPPPCNTAESCKAAPTPQPTLFGAPSSATLTGVGNMTPTLPKKHVTAHKKRERRSAASHKRRRRGASAKHSRKGRR
jgi:hypothetical protein